MPDIELRFDRLLPLIPESLLKTSGEVFYSGRAAYNRSRPVYFLGLNPGSDASDRKLNTIEESVRETKSLHPQSFSRYVDERWMKGRGLTRYSPMQRRMQHLARRVGVDLRLMPSSNLVFSRSVNADCIRSCLDDLADICWPLHHEIIRSQKIKVVICLGGDAFGYVVRRLGADQVYAFYTETNSRGWQSVAARNRDGLFVIKLTHPGRANWISPESDPSLLVEAVLREVAAE